MSFRMQTIAETSARIALNHTSVTLRLQELEDLVLNLTTLAHQMARYKLTEVDVSAFVQSAAGTRPSSFLKNRRVSLCNMTYSG